MSGRAGSAAAGGCFADAARIRCQWEPPGATDVVSFLRRRDRGRRAHAEPGGAACRTCETPLRAGPCQSNHGRLVLVLMARAWPVVPMFDGCLRASAREQEYEANMMQEVYNQITQKCFQKCIGKPGDKLDKEEQKCLAKCIDRYIDSREVKRPLLRCAHDLLVAGLQTSVRMARSSALEVL